MLQYIVDNWPALLGVFAAGLIFAKGIAKLTPTKVDDEFIERIESLEKMVKDFFPTPSKDLAQATTVVIKKS